jgi:hypothetical protein
MTLGHAAPQLGMLLGLAIAGLYAVGAPALPGLFTADSEVQLLHRISGSMPLQKPGRLEPSYCPEIL